MWSPFRRPCGVFLTGGGALGCWQAAVLQELSSAGLRAEAVMGVSVGALNGAALALGRIADQWRLWRETDGGVMRFAPRLRPFALFSAEAVRTRIDTRAEDEWRSALRCPLTVVSVSSRDRRRIYARFSPGGRDGWDAPIKCHLLATCAIPRVFPSVDVEFRGSRLTLVDGGVEASEPVGFSELGACRDIVILDPCRIPQSWSELEPGVRALQESGRARVYRIVPGRPLQLGLFDFRASSLARGMAQGEEDARRFLEDPASALVASPRTPGWARHWARLMAGIRVRRV